MQTVRPETSPRYYKLIKAFEERTGYGVIVNTSFNIRGEPIVNTPSEAYRCFMLTDMDVLVLQDVRARHRAGAAAGQDLGDGADAIGHAAVALADEMGVSRGQACVFYENALSGARADIRRIGVSKYTIRRMIRFASDGLYSFSPMPVRLAVGTGLVVSGASWIACVFASAR